MLRVKYEEHDDDELVIIVYKTKKVREDIICLNPDDDRDKAWKIMTQKGIGRFPILHEGDLVGIITRSDLVHAFRIRLEIRKYVENV